MAAKELPVFDSLVSGLGYHTTDGPTSDACSTAGGDANEVLGAPASMPAPLQAVSLATKTEEAPDNPQTWNSGDKGTDWMGGSTLPWNK